jgi:sensor domain CHASE-containing protein
LKNTGLGTKITVLICFVVLIAFSLMTWLSYSQSAASLQSSIQTDMKNIATNNSQTITEKLNGYKLACQSIALRATVQSMDWNTQKPGLASVTSSMGLLRISLSSRTAPPTIRTAPLRT